MKKTVSFLLCVSMVAGILLALIPSAAAKPASVAEPGILIYSEDFEGENLTGKTNNTLTRELGWTQWIDVPDDPATSYDDGYARGLSGRGTASIITDTNGNKAIQMKYAGTGDGGSRNGDNYGWSVEFIDNNRLTGGDYVLEYTATIDAITSTGTANGFGFRSNRAWNYSDSFQKKLLGGSASDAITASDAYVFQTHIKYNGAYDMHLKTGSDSAKSGVSGSNLKNIANTNASGKANILTLTHTFRTVVSSTEGVHTYVMDNSGAWVYYFGMDDTSTQAFTQNKDKFGSSVLLRICANVTATIDDLSVYTIKDSTTPEVKMEGSQTTVAEDGVCDFRLIGSVTDKTDVRCAGFKLSVNGGVEKKVYLNYAYASISTNYGSEKLTAPENGFLGALVIQNCPTDTQFTAKFFVEYVDGAYIEGEAASAYYQGPVESAPQNPATESNGVLVSKNSDFDRIRTVHPGDDITYTFTVTNTAAEAKQITLTDTVPSHTTYQSGSATVSGESLSWNLTVPAKETVTVSYTVAVSEDKTLKKEAISADSAKVDGKAIAGSTIYINQTFNATDMEKFSKALVAMTGTKFKGAELVKYLYYISHSTAPAITEEAGTTLNKIFVNTTADKAATYAKIVVPGLFGGKAITADMTAHLLGTQVDSISMWDIQPGDILCVLPSTADLSAGRFYATDRNNLYDLTEGCSIVSSNTVLSALAEQDMWAVLRPSISFGLVSSMRSNSLSEGQTDVEKAIIATADAFLLRGDRIQYADVRLVQDPKIYRWERGKAPEDYTSDETGYSNCTGFVHDVFYNALGYDYGDFSLDNAPAAMKAYTYTFTGNETASDRAAIEAEYKSMLKIGDIVYYTYSGNTHAMLYIGNGNMIHCTGNTYNFTDYKENEEPAIRYMHLDSLFDPNNSSRYLFQTATPRTGLYIIRPTNTWTGTSIPDAAKARINGMNGIFAEKTCSATLGQTVNPEDILTYTFTLFNTTAKAATVTVTDRIPAGSTLLENGVASAAQTMSWTVTLKPYEKKQISYTVKVSESAEAGSAILCTDESRVGGLSVKAPAVYVGRTLTAAEQSELRAIVAGTSATGDSVALANAIYRELLGIDNILGANIDALRTGLFQASGSNYAIASTGSYAEMIAPSLFGGKTVLNSDRWAGERTRMPREKNLIAGDILYLQGSGNTTYGLYLYLGDGKMIDLKTMNERDLSDRLMNTIGWNRFAIIRPSLIAD